MGKLLKATAIGSAFVIAGITLVAAFIALTGWWFMITVGVVHGEWLPGMPTIGFWSACKISALILFGPVSYAAWWVTKR